MHPEKIFFQGAFLHEKRNGENVENDLFYRPFESSDIPALRAIYLEFVRRSTATFHIGDVDEAEMRAILTPESLKYRSFVLLDKGRPCGYALYSRYRPREAFSPTAEVTIYLRKDHTGQGLGTKALGLLETSARENGFHSLVALVCHENAASIRLFEKNEYALNGRVRDVGFKFGRFLDLLLFQKML